MLYLLDTYLAAGLVLAEAAAYARRLEGRVLGALPYLIVLMAWPGLCLWAIMKR